MMDMATTGLSSEAAPQVTRELLHTRKVQFDGYLRSDGLYEIEARIQDIARVGTALPFGSIEPGRSIHDMQMAMTVDGDMVIRSMRAVTLAGATPFCAAANAAYASLAGLKIGPGFKKQVKARVGGALGCTHLTELVDGMGTAFMQTWFYPRRAQMARVRKEQPEALQPRPWVIDTCHAYRSEGEAVQVVWPPGRRAPSPRDKTDDNGDPR